MMNKLHKTNWLFWFQWTLVTSIGWGMAGVRAMFIPTPDSYFWDVVYRGIALFSIILLSGVLIGFSQWLILRQRHPRLSGWIIASFIGSFAESILFVIAVISMNALPWANSILKALVVGVTVGFSQWYVLRAHQVFHAGWWILASTWGYMGAFVVSLFFDASSVTGYWVGMTLQGFVVGGITGVAIVWLLGEQSLDAPEVRNKVSKSVPWLIRAIFGAVAGFAVLLLPLGLPVLFLIYIAYYDCGYGNKCPSDFFGLALFGFAIFAAVGGLIGGYCRQRLYPTDSSIFRGGMIGGVIGEVFYACTYIVVLFMSH